MSDIVETDEAISAELLQWADGIDAEGDDLRPLLRRAAKALADRETQMKSVIDGAAKAADRAYYLRGKVEKLERLLRQVIEDFDGAARQVGYAVPRAKALEQVEAARRELNCIRTARGQ